jgi:AraC-like DNA-binding protein
MEKNGGHRLRMLSEGKRVRFLSSAEEDFLNSLMDVIEMIWDQPDFKLANVCRQIGLSRSQLYRNITSLTGKSFVDFTREFRLKQALKLIEKDRNNITQTAFSCGFNSPSYFSKCFKERFGLLPSEFIKTL